MIFTEKLKKIIKELHPEAQISRETRLVDDKILDSLDIVALVTDINEEYGVNIGAADIIKENFNSLDVLAALIKKSGGDIICP